MSENNLVLHPVNPNWIFDLRSLGEQLRSLGFLGEHFSKNQFHHTVHTDSSDFYGAGTSFFDLIHFKSSHLVGDLELVDSKLIETTVVHDSRDLCYISLKLYKEMSFLGSILTNFPLCPNCEYQIQDWVALVDRWYSNKDSFTWTCPRCQYVWMIQELEWKHTNGFASCAIDIWGVMFEEARPSDKFLLDLKRVTGEEWTYFYFRI